MIATQFKEGLIVHSGLLRANFKAGDIGVTRQAGGQLLGVAFAIAVRNGAILHDIVVHRLVDGNRSELVVGEQRAEVTQRDGV